MKTDTEQIHRKRCKRYNHPFHLHALTFSCFHSKPFLTQRTICDKLAESLTNACARHDVALWAYVFMPEHVHLLVRPRKAEYSISAFLLAVKQPVARWVLRFHKKNQTPQLEQMATGQSKQPYRFWQAGGGYDRNFVSRDTVRNVMNYIHINPVRRKLVVHPTDWYYASYKYWYTEQAGPIECDRDSLSETPPRPSKA